jgi:hypothetical protein
MTIYLSTPCATPGCGHPYNWHTAGVCTREACLCKAFAVPAESTPGRTDQS